MPVLQIRDKDGKLIPIPCIKGERGKSAYEYLKDNGYKGTEEQFIALLNGVTAGEDSDHYADFDNPHRVTAQQIGALTITGGTLTGKTLYFDNGNTRLSGGLNYMQMDVFDNPEDDSNRRKLVLNGNSTALNGAVMLVTYENGEQQNYNLYGTHYKPTASDVGAVSKNGDTLTGAITVDKPTNWGQYVIYSPEGYYRCFEADDTRVRIDVRDDKLTTDRRFIDIFSNEGDSRHSHALRFAQATSAGDNKTEYILHTGNINNFVITKGAYDGAGSTRKTIPIRKTTQMVVVYGMEGNVAYTVGILVRGIPSAHADLGPRIANPATCDVAWADESVTVSYSLAAPMYAWDLSGVKYHYVVIG